MQLIDSTVFIQYSIWHVHWSGSRITFFGVFPNPRAASAAFGGRWLCLTKTACSSWRCFGGKLVRPLGDTVDLIDWNMFLLYPIHRQNPCLDSHWGILQRHSWTGRLHSQPSFLVKTQSRSESQRSDSNLEIQVLTHPWTWVYFIPVVRMSQCTAWKVLIDLCLHSGTCVFLCHTLCQIGCHPGSWGCTAPCCFGKSVRNLLYLIF